MAQFQTFVAFDTETTGLDSNRDQIVEIAAIKFGLELGPTKASADPKVRPVILDTFSQLVKPDMFIPEEAMKIHGITDAMVENAPKIQDVLPDFVRFCGLSTVLVAHNASFDLNFIKAATDAHNSPLLKNPVLDSLKIARKIMNEAPSHQLGELAKRLRREIQVDLNGEKLHRALYDCQVLAEVFIAILRRHFLTADFELGRFLKAVETVHGAPTQLYR
jgi:DNA polymerase-3 subunit epsilon